MGTPEYKYSRDLGLVLYSRHKAINQNYSSDYQQRPSPT